jgi:hypothetical protein
MDRNVYLEFVAVRICAATPEFAFAVSRTGTFLPAVLTIKSFLQFYGFFAPL